MSQAVRVANYQFYKSLLLSVPLIIEKNRGAVQVAISVAFLFFKEKFIMTFFINNHHNHSEFQEKYNQWMTADGVDKQTKEELKSLTEVEKKDRFYRDLEFGTGGLRGIMAAGSNRMNIYTVRKATQGLALELLSHGKTFVHRGVVIACDSRRDSKEFALECVNVLCANGIKTYLFDNLRPTPELSFAVRYLKCVRGIVITASHNSKEYNGYKVYGEDGGQISPDTASTILAVINQTDIFSDVKLCEQSQYISVGAEIDDAYITAVKKQSLGTKIPSDFKIVYTPLHGSGNLLVPRILREIGAKQVFVVPEQEKPDGNFPTVLSPNPENSESFELAREYAKQKNADIVFGTDPDGDRIGVLVRTASGEYSVLNGNQIGCLLCEYILRKTKESGELPTNGVVVKTIVTTKMVYAIAKDYGVKVIDVLTGFKYIGEKIKEFEHSGTYKFLFGLEESYGYLKGTYARDKDAVVAAMLILELAADYKAKGMTLYEGLQELYKRYGYYKECLKTKTLKGLFGAEKIKEIMMLFRTSTLPIKIVDTIDYSNGVNGLPKSDVLKFILPDGWVAVRPSGTEPKIKIYFEVSADSEEKADERLRNICQTVMKYIDDI